MVDLQSPLKTDSESTGKTAVILAGGAGRRLGTLTENTPKPLLPILGKPFLIYLLTMLSKFDFGRVIILCGPYKTIFEQRVKIFAEKYSPDLVFVDEPCPAGTAGALRYISPKITSDFLLINGDSYFPIDFDRFFRRREAAYVCAMALHMASDTRRYGRVKLKQNQIIKFEEKAEDRGSGLVNTGVYCMSKEILEWIPKAPASLERDVLPKLLSEGLIQGMVYDSPFIDIGTPEDFNRAPSFLKKWLNTGKSNGSENQNIS
tara:strand:+ start:2302 stop:3084 length:783 start_codon:yes stop_codon:yes gene_type:complete